MKFGVRFSGHGSKFIFDKFRDGCIFKYTREEANEIGLKWELNACTIGGRAEIVREDGQIFEIIDTYDPICPWRERAYIQ